MGLYTACSNSNPWGKRSGEGQRGENSNTKPHLSAHSRAPASFLPDSPQLPGAPRCGQHPSSHGLSRNLLWKVSVIESFVSELKLSEESCLNAKVKCKGETEA